jgi:hypothetical protein
VKDRKIEIKRQLPHPNAAHTTPNPVGISMSDMHTLGSYLMQGIKEDGRDQEVRIIKSIQERTSIGNPQCRKRVCRKRLP